jgi:hypothetical protein
MMLFQKILWMMKHPPRADDGVSKLNVDYKRSHSNVKAGFIIGINF